MVGEMLNTYWPEIITAVIGFLAALLSLRVLLLYRLLLLIALPLVLGFQFVLIVIILEKDNLLFDIRWAILKALSCAVYGFVSFAVTISIAGVVKLVIEGKRKSRKHM